MEEPSMSGETLLAVGKTLYRSSLSQKDGKPDYWGLGSSTFSDSIWSFLSKQVRLWWMTLGRICWMNYSVGRCLCSLHSGKTIRDKAIPHHLIYPLDSLPSSSVCGVFPLLCFSQLKIDNSQSALTFRSLLTAVFIPLRTVLV